MKHSELLSAKTELVMPLNYKRILNCMGNIDSTIVFLKEVRKQETLSFDDICTSVKQSFGRDCNANILRQILAIVPEFYN